MEKKATPTPSIEFIHRTFSEDDFDGYRAAPLLIVGGRARKSLIHSQDKLAENFALATISELHDMVKPSVVEFVARSIITRMHQREGLNSISYLRRLNKQPDIHAVPDVLRTHIREACTRSRSGGASVQQNHIARQALGMGSIELANLTMIKEFRKSQEAYMWDDISELVGHEATPVPEEMYGLKVLGFDRDIHKSTHIGALRIGMKRIISQLEDGTVVKGRTSAIINTSPSSGFDQSIAELFREVSSDEESRQDYSSIEALPEFHKAVEWLIQGTPPVDIVLARNETVYEDNPEVQLEIAKRRECGKAA